MDDVPDPAAPPLFTRLRDHFVADPAGLPVIEQTVAAHDQPNLHLGMIELLADAEPGHELIGLVAGERYSSPSLTKLAQTATAAGYRPGPVLHADVDIGSGERLACVKQGLYLFRDAGRPAAVLVVPSSSYFDRGTTVEVMAADRPTAERVSRRLTTGVRQGRAFRGKVLSVTADCRGGTQVQFHTLPAVPRDGLILPDELLRRLERQATGLSRHATRLRAAGRHLKRGILLHGKPGTGKTLSAMYLASLVPDRTVLVLTGGGVGSIETACGLARLLQPCTVILEDVDLIGTERRGQQVGANALLFELLNQMDGLGEDADILFVLTTNRPDHLEPALAARPGRVDLALEVPLPDADCRRRLFELYARGLRLGWSDPGRWVGRTAGVSAAFIRELLRKAAVLAAEADPDGTGELAVTDAHLEDALGELLVAGGPLTQTLLGVDAAASGAQPATA